MKNGLIIDIYGSNRYYLNGELHRVDGPAVEWADGSNVWYVDGELHREDGPAQEWADGSKIWYVDGKPHREDGPAVELADGTKLWYLHDKELIHPEEFETMEAFVQHLNNNEEYSLQWINDINGLIEMIKKPTGKQTRLHAMRWKI